jgi:adenylate cyclase
VDAALTRPSTPPSGLLITALAPVIPQILGSAFNIWYNAIIVNPLLGTAALRERFLETVVAYNLVAYPVAVAVWLWLVFSLRKPFRNLSAGREVDPQRLDQARRRVVHLPWFGAAVSGLAWLLCIPVFLGALLSVGQPLSLPLLWHLPISFLVSAFISVTQSFFLIELASHWGLFPLFFHNARPDQMKGIYPLSLRGRGLMWAISAGLCPIGSLLMLDFAPPSPAGHPVWFAAFVGTIGIAFGLCSAVLISRLVAEPVDHLRRAAQAVAEGRLDVHVPLKRADEFGSLIGEFNRMVGELRDKERLRQTFGLHVGRKAAEQILARDPGLGGTIQEITVMFVDIRSFTARAADGSPEKIVSVLNEFLRVMVHVVEEHHSGMINKFLGDGFMALFGAGAETEAHADEAVHASRAMLRVLHELNIALAERGEQTLQIGIGLNTGPAVVGSIGSPERLEFTAIGNTVNLASRIESLTKVVAETVVLSDTTRAALQRPTALRELPPQTVKGVERPLRVWALGD